MSPKTPRPKPPRVPPPAEETPRQALERLLHEGDWTVRELARELHRPHKVVESDLNHLRHSLGREGLAITPAVCDGCGFVFRKRDRLTTPSRCPQCRSERIDGPRVRLG